MANTITAREIHVANDTGEIYGPRAKRAGQPIKRERRAKGPARPRTQRGTSPPQ